MVREAGTILTQREGDGRPARGQERGCQPSAPVHAVYAQEE